MLYRIGICDDDNCFLDVLELSLENYAKQKLFTFEILKFSSGEALLDVYQDYHFNLLILDMEMPGLSGIETAHKIRDVDLHISILYSTVHENFAFQAFQVDADSYICKPFSDVKLFSKLNRIFDKLYLQACLKTAQDTYLALETKDGIIQIPCDEIIYISKMRNELTVHTTSHEHTAYMNIKDIRLKLDPSIFVKINNGEIVNWSKIEFLKDNLIYLDRFCKIELTISRSNLSELSKRYRRESEQLLKIRESEIYPRK